jgi:hypothetical protein
VIPPPAGEPASVGGPVKNHVWLALPLTLDVRQPFNLARLRRFVERPGYLGGIPFQAPGLDLAADWAKHAGKHIDKVSPANLAEFCIGHSLDVQLPADYYPAGHAFPFEGSRRVRIYDTHQDTPRAPLQVAVFLLDLPLVNDPKGMKFETSMINVRSPAHVPAAQDWSLIRALKFSVPGLTYLKDLLPHAASSVVFKQSMVPIHSVVAERLSGGSVPTREFLVQFTEQDYENSAWIKQKFVPQRYVDDFHQRGADHEVPGWFQPH